MVALEEHPGALGSAPWPGETGRAWHEQVLADPGQEHLTGEIRGEMVGFAILSGIGTSRVELHRIVLSAQWAGDGPARMFLRGLVARAHERHDAQQVWLHVRASDEQTRAFYASEGFVAAGDRPALHLTPDGGTAALAVMAHRR